MEKIPPKEDARFGPLRAMAEENWREHSPKLVKLLEKQGNLEQRLDEATENAILILNQCQEQGLAPDQARELAYENLLQPTA